MIIFQMINNVMQTKFDIRIELIKKEYCTTENCPYGIDLLALVYFVASLARIIILIVCTVYQQWYKLLFPATLIIITTQYALYVGQFAEEEMAFNFLTILDTVVVPLIFYSSLRYSIIVSISASSIV